MTASLLDGKAVASFITNQLATAIAHLPAQAIRPKLAIIQIEGDEASTIYVHHKCATAERIGIFTEHFLLPTSTTFEALKETVLALNHNPTTHGILLQLPLPSHLPTETLLALIDPVKDVDGLTPYNQGLLLQNQPGLRPCTPGGIMRLLQHYQIELAGKQVVIVNASKLVGKPLAMEMLAAKATVTICNSRTTNLSQYIQQADIVVSATGKAHIIDTAWLKPGCIGIDVGVYRDPRLGIIGDFDFASAKTIASWITPVPGGVGPMTVAMLMKNVWQAYQKQIVNCIP